MELPSWMGKLYVLASLIAAIFDVTTVHCQSFKRSLNSRISYAQFVGNPLTKLTILPLATLQVSSLGECTFECINNKECFSVNFGAKTPGKHVCELINTDRFSQLDKFAASQDFDHYNIKVGCRVIRIS